MNFFDKDFFLFTSSQQTFVATIATLVVLCSYKSNSNFLSSLTDIFKEVFRKDIKHKIEGLKNAFDFSFLDECNIFTHSSEVSEKDRERLLNIQLEADTIRNDFFNDATEEKVKNSQDSFNTKTKTNDEKPFPLLMAFFTFVMCVSVLTVDSLNLNKVFGVCLLFLFDLGFLVLTISGWVEYWKDDIFIEKNNKKRWLWCVAAFLMIILVAFHLPLFLKVILLAASILCISCYYFESIVRKCKNDDYNIRFVAKFEVLWMGISAIMALIVYCATQFDFLYIAVPKPLQNWFDVIIDNCFLVVNGLLIWRWFFIVLCVTNAFILPLLLKFLYDRKNWYAVKTPIDNKLSEANTKIEDLKSKYSVLKAEILNKH